LNMGKLFPNKLSEFLISLNWKE